MSELHTLRFANGKIVKHWANVDQWACWRNVALRLGCRARNAPIRFPTNSIEDKYHVNHQ